MNLRSNFHQEVPEGVRRLSAEVGAEPASRLGNSGRNAQSSPQGATSSAANVNHYSSSDDAMAFFCRPAIYFGYYPRGPYGSHEPIGAAVEMRTVYSSSESPALLLT